MRISTRTRYGLRAMTCLALRYGKGPVSVREMADAQDLPPKYLEHLFASLKAEGLVRSVRGPGGGYTLSRPPQEIKVLTIYRALEGSIAPMECLETPEVCPKRGSCPTRDVWQQASEAMEHVLEERTLADLVVAGDNHCASAEVDTK